MPAYRQQLGRRGEEAAAAYLKSCGFSLIAKNVRCPLGEIDLLMTEGTTVVVIEVKSQSQLNQFNPILKVDGAKQKKLKRLAEWTALRYPDRNVRIDIVTVCISDESALPRIAYYPNCINF